MHLYLFYTAIALILYPLSFLAESVQRVCVGPMCIIFDARYLKNLHNPGYVLISMESNDETQQVGYMALGIGSSMSDADMYIAYPDKNSKDSAMKLIERKGVGHKPPEKFVPNINSAEVISNSGDDAKYSFNTKALTFKLNISDINLNPNSNSNSESNRKVLYSDKPNSFIWAFSHEKPLVKNINNEDDVSITKHSNFGSFEYNFSDKSAKLLNSHGSPTMPLVHGILMIISWIFMPISAIFIARYLKSLGKNWFRLHIGLFVMTGILSVVAIILMMVKIGITIFNPHSILGFVITGCYIIQICVGVYIDKKYDPNRKSIPLHDKFHWWFGRSIFLFALGNILYGIILFNFYLTAWLVVVLSTIVMSACVFAIYEYKGKTH